MSDVNAEEAVIVDRETLAAQLADLREHHRRVVEQRNKDFNALMVLIAQSVGDNEERECAECDEMDEFDPWFALRRHMTDRDSLRTRLASVEKLCEEALDGWASCGSGWRSQEHQAKRLAIRAALAKKETL